eukprot:c24594_g1_i1 orf=1222-1599(+)
MSTTGGGDIVTVNPPGTPQGTPPTKVRGTTRLSIHLIEAVGTERGGLRHLGTHRTKVPGEDTGHLFTHHIEVPQEDTGHLLTHHMEVLIEDTGHGTDLGQGQDLHLMTTGELGKLIIAEKVTQGS